MVNQKNIKNLLRPELLAPGGNIEKVKTAFAFGADAVYLGVPEFSLRTRINNFDVDSLREAVLYAHSLDKKAYVTLNIFAHNSHLERLASHVKELKDIGPDGLFISDPGVLMTARQAWPEANYILSTQANCTNWQTAKFWFDLGIKRVILARELSLDEIKEIKKRVPGLELECFVHGALCMAYSGRCFLSKLLKDRDANLGDCAQPCRWSFKSQITNPKLQIIKQEAIEEEALSLQIEGSNEKFELVEEERGSYIFNSQDLCLIKRMPELIEAGIDAFKIEGRAKSVYYIACVVGAYRKAIDLILPLDKGGWGDLELTRELENLYNELETKLVHRGYTEGFMFDQGKLAQNLDNSHNESEWEFCGQVFKMNNEEFIMNNRIREFKNYIRVHNSLKLGDEIEVLRPGCDIIKMSVDRLFDVEGNLIKETHGGQEQTAVIPHELEWGDFSVIRRKVARSM